METSNGIGNKKTFEERYEMEYTVKLNIIENRRKQKLKWEQLQNMQWPEINRLK